MKSMRSLLPFVVLLMTLVGCESDDTEPAVETGLFTKSVVVDGIDRKYLVHLPDNYDGKQELPVVINLHGHGHIVDSVINNFGDYFFEHGSANDIIGVWPQALEDLTGKTSWNTRAGNGHSPKDILFMKEMISALDMDYTIDRDRIYASGFSNGGAFAFEMACRMSDEIAAIGAVSGVLTDNQLDDCSPGKPVPIIQIHGTFDLTWAYQYVQRTIDHWIDVNGTLDTAVVSELPNIDLNDNSTVERHVYPNGDAGSEVVHLKVIGGRHHWPGLEGNMDIHATYEIWDFVSRYDINGKIR